MQKPPAHLLSKFGGALRPPCTWGGGKHLEIFAGLQLSMGVATLTSRPTTFPPASPQIYVCLTCRRHLLRVRSRAREDGCAQKGELVVVKVRRHCRKRPQCRRRRGVLRASRMGVHCRPTKKSGTSRGEMRDASLAGSRLPGEFSS